jgi:CHAD domain-containing protein
VDHEIELKLIAGDAFDEDELVRRLAELGTIDAAVREEHRDTYLDTDGGELRAAGLSARVRQRPRERAVMVKPVPIDPGLVMRRRELVAPLDPGSDPAGVLARLLARELDVRLGSKVSPVLELVTDRTVRLLQLHPPPARATIEICVDRVRVLAPSQTEVGSFCEVEAELASGDARELDTVARALVGASLQPSGQGKYTRARELADLPAYDYGPSAPDFDGDTPRGEVARAVCRHQLAKMRAYEPGTRVGLDIEHLHKMRVASRRLRTALRVFRRSFRKKDRKHLAAELEWIGARLGDVRDLDVHELDVAKWRERLGEDPAAGWDMLAERLAARRAVAQARLIAALDNHRWPALCERASATFASGDRDGKAIWMVAPALVGRRVERFSAGVEQFRRSHSPADAHRLRILGKRLRYAAEFLEPLLSDETRAQLQRLSDFQDTLGELQDTVQAGAFVKAQTATESGPRGPRGEPVPAALAVVLDRVADWADETAAAAPSRVDAALEALRPAEFAAALQRELAPHHDTESEADDGST